MGYSELYLKHFQAPQNVGELEEPRVLAEVEHQGGGCFDRLRVTLRIEGGIVQDAMFKARACSGTIAASSAVTEWVKGKSVEEAGTITADMLDEYLGGVPERKRHSIELAAEAIQKAVSELE